MERFLIEVPHAAEPASCLEAVRLLLASGSHFLTHADFGCMDGVHKSWIVVEADNKDEARCSLPPLYRADARVVKLTKFSLGQVDAMIQNLHKE